MTIDALIALVRQAFIDDGASRYSWSDETLVSHANEAQSSACRRAGILTDTLQASDADSLPLCSLSVITGTATYRISSKVLRVLKEGTYLSSVGLNLDHKTEDWLNEFYEYWRTATGTPTIFTYTKGLITLVPKPVANDTLNLEVVRLPLVDMKLGGCELVGAMDISFNATNKTITTVGGNFLTQGFLPYKATIPITGTVSNNIAVTPVTITAKVMTVSETLVTEANTSAVIRANSYPEIPEEYHYALIDGICSLAYQMQDSETLDVNKAKIHEAKFTNKFGPEPSARVEIARRKYPANGGYNPKTFGG